VLHSEQPDGDVAVLAPVERVQQCRQFAFAPLALLRTGVDGVGRRRRDEPELRRHVGTVVVEAMHVRVPVHLFVEARPRFAAAGPAEVREELPAGVGADGVGVVAGLVDDRDHAGNWHG
jgi:hypothetical protein